MPIPLTIDDLFSPAVSGVGPNPPPSGSWLAQILANADILQLNTTAWQPGSAGRTILEICANLLAKQDGIISTMAQGGFLDYAATGTVTYVALNGVPVTNPVTPDPSDPEQNPTGALGWLDLLANSVYNVQRIPAQAATGPLTIVNTSGNIYGPYIPGSYHVTDSVTNQTYSNVDNFIINPSNLHGSPGDNTVGIISIGAGVNPVVTTTTPHGLLSGVTVYIFGTIGGNLTARFGAISVTGPNTFNLNGVFASATGAGTGGVYDTISTNIICDISGPNGTAGATQINTQITSNQGVVITNVTALAGVNWESNTQLANRCRLKLASLSPNGARGAYEYFALTAADVLANQTPPVPLIQPITRVLVQTSITNVTLGSSQVQVVVANANGIVTGITSLPILDATGATPIEITTSLNHGLNTNDYVIISGVFGNTNANGTFQITVTAVNKFTLNNSVGNSFGGGLGFVEGGDLGLIDSVIQQWATPDAVASNTISATIFNVNVQATISVPQAQVANYLANATTAITNYFANLPIGGIVVGAIGKIIFADVLGVLYQAGSINNQPSYVRQLTLLLNTGTVDLNYPNVTDVAVLTPPPTLSIIGY